MRQSFTSVVFSATLAAMKVLVASFVFALVLIGCKTNLQPGGAYAPTATNIVNGVTNVVATPDIAFFTVDSTFDLAYSAIDAAFRFETDNRALLWKLSPNIKHALDRFRPQALTAAQHYAVARKNYLLNPTPAGLNNLQGTLAEMQRLSNAVTNALPRQ